jgi:hypothetical protein
MGLYRIWGFLLPDQATSATWGTQTSTETCLIEMDSPLEDIVEVQAALPAYDFGSTEEPTFTFGLSYHPDRTDLILKGVTNLREHPESGRPFWLIDLVYETGQWLNDIFPGENVGPGNIGYQRRLKDNVGTASTPRELIEIPWLEPPTWNSSTRRVKMTRYKDATGVTMRHSNFLPLTEGIDIDMGLEVHTFTWNVRYDTFNFETNVAPYIGTINTTAMPRLKGAPAKHVLLETVTCTENYRQSSVVLPNGQAPGGLDQPYHFITLTATFVVDRRTAIDSPEGYHREANRRVSMHTQELINGGIANMSYGPITINDRGDFAQSPWPLRDDGSAYPYATMDTADPDVDFYTIDPLLPLESDLAAFTVLHDLEVP